MRIAFVSRGASIDDMLVIRLRDPLFDFCQSIERGSFARFGETVNLASLITAAGALRQWSSKAKRQQMTWRARQWNRRCAAAAVEPCASSAIHESLASGTLLLRLHQLLREPARPLLAAQGIVASEPWRGLVRLAMPTRPFRNGEISRLRNAVAGLTIPRCYRPTNA